ncbi:MAG: hypothetical protein Q8N12_05935 [Thermodesulfovibrionales bacterium]|nr:hypothetical protein [Thermodesulfovibrionales bacterium]
MTNEEIKDQLKQLLNIKEFSEGFKSQQDCIDWSNKVAPLLKFNEEHYQTFREAAHRINVIGLSMKFQDSNLNIMKSAATQALIELENNSTPPSVAKTSIDLPQKITIPWLWRNLHWTVLPTLVSLLVSAFLAGFFIGQSKWGHDLMERYSFSSKDNNIQTQKATTTEKSMEIKKAPIKPDNTAIK